MSRCVVCCVHCCRIQEPTCVFIPWSLLLLLWLLLLRALCMCQSSQRECLLAPAIPNTFLLPRRNGETGGRWCGKKCRWFELFPADWAICIRLRTTKPTCHPSVGWANAIPSLPLDEAQSFQVQSWMPWMAFDHCFCQWWRRPCSNEYWRLCVTLGRILWCEGEYVKRKALQMEQTRCFVLFLRKRLLHSSRVRSVMPSTLLNSPVIVIILLLCRNIRTAHFMDIRNMVCARSLLPSAGMYSGAFHQHTHTKHSRSKDLVKTFR